MSARRIFRWLGYVSAREYTVIDLQTGERVAHVLPTRAGREPLKRAGKIPTP